MEASALRSGPVPARRLAPLRRMASDERLVAAVRAGRGDAFETVYDRYHRQLLSFCRHMLGSREEAEDAVQHTFMAAYSDLRRSGKPIQLRPWLYAIARNHCLSLLRARREHASIEDVEPAVEGLAPAVARREDLQELLRDLARLPDDQRSALLLSELGALSHDEIADVIDCPAGKVKALVFQARSSLSAGRQARETPCAEIREQLATLTGGSLRRAGLRRHLQDCPGCREFQGEVRRQRQAMALVLPVVPTAALKGGVMSAAAVQAGGAGIAAAGGGAVASGGGMVASSGGVGAVLAKAGATKLLVAGVIAVAGTGGTVAAVNAVDPGDKPKRHEAPAARGGSSGSAASGAVPSGVTPTRAHGEHALGRLSGGVANGKNPKGEHGRSETAPGHAGTSPGQAGTAPGLAGTTPGRSGTAPGHARPDNRGSGGGQGQSGADRGNSGNAPGPTGTGNGRSGEAPGQTGSTLGPSESASPNAGTGAGEVKETGRSNALPVGAE
jgi:RNA polymerase sigma factor (sigma-70 family)